MGVGIIFIGRNIASGLDADLFPCEDNESANCPYHRAPIRQQKELWGSSQVSFLHTFLCLESSISVFMSLVDFSMPQRIALQQCEFGRSTRQCHSFFQHFLGSCFFMSLVALDSMRSMILLRVSCSLYWLLLFNLSSAMLQEALVTRWGDK